MTPGILLCVDDEVIVLNALKDQLRKVYGAKHMLEVAESAEEGLEILDELSAMGHMPLVIISDWLMPNMTGDEFLIEAHKRFPYVVTIMLSGHADIAAVQRTRQHGNLREFLSKPWNPQELIRCIDQGLAGYAGPAG